MQLFNVLDIKLRVVVKVSFTDFLRFHLVPVPPDGAPAVLPNGMPVEPAPQAAPVPAPEGGAPAVAGGARNQNEVEHRHHRMLRAQRNEVNARQRRQDRANRAQQDNNPGAPADAARATEDGADQADAAQMPRIYRRGDHPFNRPPTPATDTLLSGQKTPGIAMNQTGEHASEEQPAEYMGYEQEEARPLGTYASSGVPAGAHMGEGVPDLVSDSSDSSDNSQAQDRLSDEDSDSSWETFDDDQGHDHDHEGNDDVGDGGVEGAVDVNDAEAVRERVANHVRNQMRGDWEPNANAEGEYVNEYRCVLATCEWDRHYNNRTGSFCQSCL